jgi:hypothetical protein
MRALAGSGDEGVLSSVAEGLEEGTGEERVSAGGGGGEERDVIGKEGGETVPKFVKTRPWSTGHYRQ